MLPVIRSDFTLMIKSLKQILAVLAILIATWYATSNKDADSLIRAVYSISMIVSVLMITGIFNTDYEGEQENFYKASPVTPKQYVFAKFSLAAIVTIVSVAVLFASVIAFFRKASFREVLSYSELYISLNFIVFSVNTIGITLFGKKIARMGPFFIWMLMFLVYLVMTSAIGYRVNVQSFLKNSVQYTLVCSLAIFAISSFLCYRITERRW